MAMERSRVRSTERLSQLPLAVQADKVRAAYRDGVLEIALPKAEELKPREIKIDIQGQTKGRRTWRR
jgi:HSP20 family molecular chaperone IbpA